EFQRTTGRKDGSMKRIAQCAVACLLGASSSWAQTPTAFSSGSLWVADYSAASLRAAVSAGKNTLIYSGGSSLSVPNHVEVARYVAKRVAEELGDALVLPVVPDSPQSGDRAYRDIMSAVSAARFTSVFVIADE